MKYTLNYCNLLHFSEINYSGIILKLRTTYVGAKISKTVRLITALFLVITHRVRQFITDVSGHAVIHIRTYILSLNVGTKLPILSM